MERRIRSFAERGGVEALPELPDASCAGTAASSTASWTAITINVSQLWRNPEQWDVLRRRTCCPSSPATGRIRAWSAGCSYGAEAYTLAAVAAEAMPAAPASRCAAPTSTARIVARAQRGRFCRPTPATRRRSSSSAGSTATATATLATRELRRAMRVRRRATCCAMRTAPARSTSCSAATSSSTSTRRSATTSTPRLAGALRPGGYLMVGATERVADAGAPSASTTSHPFIYRKAA